MTYVDVLQEKRREVLVDIERLRGEAAEIAARLTAKEAQLRNLEDLLAIEETPSAEFVAAADTPQRTATSTSKRFTDAAVEILSERGVPAHYQELARVLSERGVYVPGKDPAANLIAHMLRDPRFARSSGRGMYGLSSWLNAEQGKPARSGRTRMSRSRPATTRPRKTRAHG